MDTPNPANYARQDGRSIHRLARWQLRRGLACWRANADLHQHPQGCVVHARSQPLDVPSTPEGMNWIDFKDEFPEEEGMVLLCNNLEGFVTAGYYENYFYGHCWKVNGDSISIDEFTHWMPLPEPPKP